MLHLPPASSSPAAFSILRSGSHSTPAEVVGPRRVVRAAAPAAHRLERQLAAARAEHRALSAQVHRLDRAAYRHSAEARLLKKRRLREKDRIAALLGALRAAREAAGAWELGRGGCGKVVLGRAIGGGGGGGGLVAVKLQPRGEGSLKREAHVLHALRGKGRCFPRRLHFGRQRLAGEAAEVLVMELLGPSLEQLWWATSGGTTLSPTCVLLLGVQMLSSLRRLHATGYVHNDVKPSNFCLGLSGPAARRVHLVDFGLCTARGEHLHATGTPLFSSADAQSGRPPVGADDVESLVYVLVYLARGTLPWEEESHKTALAITGGEEIASLTRTKRGTSRRALVDGLPWPLACTISTLAREVARARGVPSEEAEGLGLDYSACTRALHRGLVYTVRRDRRRMRRRDARWGGSVAVWGVRRSGFDWTDQGISWRPGGEIVDADGATLTRAGSSSQT